MKTKILLLAWASILSGIYSYVHAETWSIEKKGTDNAAQAATKNITVVPYGNAYDMTASDQNPEGTYAEDTTSSYEDPSYDNQDEDTDSEDSTAYEQDESVDNEDDTVDYGQDESVDNKDSSYADQGKEQSYATSTDNKNTAAYQQYGNTAPDKENASVYGSGDKSGSDYEDTVTDMVSAEAEITGDQQVPAVDTSAEGKAFFFIDTANNKLYYLISYSGLTGGKEISSHIHGPATEGQNADALFPLPLGKAKAGVWSYKESEEADILAGKTYVNIHSEKFPDGEIRGQIIPDDLAEE